MANKKPRDESAARTGRRPRLTPSARAQAQRDAFSRRVVRRSTHLLRYGTPGVQATWENFPWGEFFQECDRQPIRGVNRVTGMSY